MTEDRLFLAFDFQRFAGSPRLQAVIDAAHWLYAPQQLDDEDLDLVAGGSAPKPPQKPEEPK